MTFITASLIIGIIATAIFDLWGLLVAVLRRQPRPRWDMAGRWFWHMAQGRFRHDDMAALRPVGGESLLGWVLHYVIGVIYAALIPLIWGMDWLEHPTLAPALIVGVVTVLAGWLLMSPGMGNGIAASRAPHPWTVRGLQLAAHVVFGLGLWIGALIYSM
ncbi:DUF2938 domain-containing protein [Falsirhodobacter sp. 20TX0035]|uniref:DUF2938 domain-containing protein n=1 Tax=Falsirhodobacter sp. 20TX0035 TaxID=3022019 RepID=UPI00232C9DFD|nr:DUF2938 domain-containing protein [Falsirhodobacter sp. 20TX0035]MDB6452770.1 DUF2938 domain-containing protein [Falsirhodobacter sp. 20TX0035]